MTGENSQISAGRRLNTWKEIAAFIGRNERTVKRWEEARGLPVRRMPGTGHAAVFAYADEIEAWLRGRNVPGSAPSESDANPLSPIALPSKPARLARGALVLLVVGVTAAIAYAYFALRENSLAAQQPLHGHVPDRVAAEFYRSGLHEWQTREPAGIARAVADFNRAVGRDPRYASAYVGLADAYDLQAEFTTAPADQAYPKAAAAAKRALALDASLAGAHAALAFADFYGLRDLTGAEREFRRALALDQASVVTHHWYATFLMTIGQYDAALAEIDKAQNLDSESTAIPADKALILFHAGKREEALRLLMQLEDEQPNFASPHRYLATIWLADAADSAYLRELRLFALSRHDSQVVALAAVGAQGLARAGHDGMLRAMFAVQRRLYASQQQSAFALAATCAELGDREDALSYLGISVARREADNIAMKIDPPFAVLHNDRRFAALLAKAGLMPSFRPPA